MLNREDITIKQHSCRLYLCELYKSSASCIKISTVLCYTYCSALCIIIFFMHTLMSLYGTAYSLLWVFMTVYAIFPLESINLCVFVRINNLFFNISPYFGLPGSFPSDQLLVRTYTGKKRNVYLASGLVKELTLRNESVLRVCQLCVE